MQNQLLKGREVPKQPAAPYVHASYPRCLFHADGTIKVARNAAQAEVLQAAGFQDGPVAEEETVTRSTRIDDGIVTEAEHHARIAELEAELAAQKAKFNANWDEVVTRCHALEDENAALKEELAKSKARKTSKAKPAAEPAPEA